mgnify:CR=1 FL=1
MTRKLAVTAFAMSLTLVGCGSSSTTKSDAAPDVKPPTDVPRADTAIPDTGLPTQPDTLAPDTAQPDLAVDVGIDTARRDAPVIDVGVDANDTGAVGEVGVLPDTRPADTGPDGGIDAPRLDALDAAAVDAPDAGDGSSLEAGDDSVDVLPWNTPCGGTSDGAAGQD